MALTYMIGTTTFAALCSLVWLLTGGSIASAFGLYLISGQIAMIAFVARAALSQKIAARSA